jgi:RNA polymerase sigma-70 factor (ECF subfamily)
MSPTPVADAIPVAVSCADAQVPSLTMTLDLLALAKQGDGRATEKLFARCMPQLLKWSHGRLPPYARDLANTQDIVQDALVSMLNHLDRFESRHPGALLAFLRQVVTNRIRDEIRRVVRRPLATELDTQQLDPAPLPLDIAIQREGMAHYQTALRRLRPCEREAIVARVEQHHNYETVALLLGKPNANAARVAVTRALAKLAVEISALTRTTRTTRTRTIN